VADLVNDDSQVGNMLWLSWFVAETTTGQCSLQYAHAGWLLCTQQINKPLRRNQHLSWVHMMSNKQNCTISADMFAI